MRNYLTNFWIKAILVIFAGLLVYLPLLSGYFIQEEWHLLLNFYLKNSEPYLKNIISFFIPQPGQYVPLAQITAYSIFQIFKVNYNAYLVIGLLLHGVIGYLLFLWFHQITKQKKESLLVAFIFVIAPHHFQATSWIMANIGYTLSAIFMIMSFIFFTKWLEIAKLKFALLSSFFILSSVLSKDISIYVIIFLPATALLLKERRDYFIKSIFIVLPSLILEIWHFWYLKVNPYSELLVTSPPDWQNLLTLPLRSIAESIIPQHTIYWLSKLLLLLFPPYSLEKLNTTTFNQQVESVGALIVVIIITLLFIGIGIWLRKLSGKKNQFRIFLVGGLLTSLASLPYFFVDTKNFSLLQPRYIYIPLMGMCLVAIPVINIAFKKWRLKLVVSLSIIVVFFMISTWKMSNELASTGNERKHILENISKSLPSKSVNAIFYVQSDTSFYGLPDDVKTLPFQVGPAKILAAYLHDKVYLPKEVYNYFTFLEIGSEGFFADEKGSFGYLRNYDSLQSLVQGNKIRVEDIYSFRYTKRLGNVVNITEEIRNKLKGKI